VEPILAVPGIRAAIQQSDAPVVAVTPIIGGKAIKGPAAKMMGELGLEVSASAVASRYSDIIDGFVIDQTDPVPEPLPGIRFFGAATLMSTNEDRLLLARAVLQAAHTIDVNASVA
jgi:LPPG:FO 2-phospho-L-lactate transferase